MNKTLLALAVSSVVAAPGITHAIDAKISGQVNRAIVSHDNGEQSATSFVDNVNSGSRMRITGSETFETQSGNEVEYGLKWEWQHESNKSSAVTAGQDNDGTDGSVNIRHQSVYVKGDIGQLTLGQTDGAANGTAEVDLSGTGVVSYSDAASDLLGGIDYVTSNGASTGATVGGLTGQFDGLGRHDLIRYDSPAFGPVKLAASFGNGSSTEIAARYAAELGDGNKLVAALGFAEPNQLNTSYDSRTSFSTSFLAAGGLNLTLSYSTQKTDGTNGAADTDLTFTYLKAGYKMGQHAVSLDYGMRDNDNGTSVTIGADTYTTGDSDSISLGYVYKPAPSIDLYASYRVESTDDFDNAVAANADASIDDVQALVMGGRIKF